MPAVSIIIPVYNREAYVADAVRSILSGSWRDLELVLVDDGSTDGSVAAVEALGDPRVRVERHVVNRGIPAARNTGLAAARGRYIGWLDSDDVARPTRLDEQVAFLEANSDIALVGCAAGKLRPDGTRRRGTRVPPLAPGDVAAWLLFRSAFQQSSLLGRAEVLRATHYRAEFPVCEDLDVFVRLARDHRLANLPRVLIDRRLHPDQTVRRRQALIRERKTALYAAPLAELGAAPTTDDLARHVLLGKTQLDPADVPADFLAWAEAWLTRLLRANAASGYVDQHGLALACGWFWLLACRATGGSGAMAKGLTSPLARGLASAHGRQWFAQALPLLLRRR